MNATGLYALNGNDMWTTYGYAPLDGSDGFIGFPSRKDPPQYDWEDENGIDYDLTAPFFKDKTVTLTGHIIAANKTDFWTKRDALWNALKAPGELTLTIAELERSFQVFYTDSTFDMLTAIKSSPGDIGVKISLTFTVIYS